MNKIFAVMVLLASFLPACAVEDFMEDRFEDRQEARRVCVDRARETGHNVAGVRSVNRESRDRYRVRLDVSGVNQTLTCEYSDRSRTADLHW
jgi:hypothetical protein